VNQDPIADFRGWQAVWFVEPTADGTRMAIDLSGERLQIEKIFQDLRGHCCTEFVTVQGKLRTFLELSKAESDKMLSPCLLAVYRMKTVESHWLMK
jgi:hypothetical protein